MRLMTQRIDVLGVKRFCLAVVLAVAFASPVVAQDNDQALPSDAELNAAVVLPDDPSRQQTKAYIAALVKLNNGLKDRGIGYERLLESMATYQKFDAVPDQYIDLLIANLSEWWIKPEIAQSIARRDSEVIKPIIIAGLDKHPDNIIAIRYFGWYEDAKEPILRKFEKTETLHRMPNEDNWLHAFTYVAEPKHYPKIKQLFVSSFRRSQKVRLLETMPDYDILDTVRACIVDTEQNIAAGNPKGDYLSQVYIELERLCVIAARAGDIDSLGKLIDALNRRKPDASIRYYSVGDYDLQRDNVTQLISFKGSNKEISQWFETNRDKLAFDSIRKRFIIKDEF
jgi:hypothetical protein